MRLMTRNLRQRIGLRMKPSRTATLRTQSSFRYSCGPLAPIVLPNMLTRRRVRAMTTRKLERGEDEDVEPREMDPPAAGRLSEIHVPTLVIVGGQDVRPIHIIADTLAKGIAGARKVIIPGTAHHLNMELPEEFNQVVIEFLEQI